MVHYFEPPIETAKLPEDLERQPKSLKRKRRRRRRRDDSENGRPEETEFDASDAANLPSEDYGDEQDDKHPDFPHAPYKNKDGTLQPRKPPNASQRSLKHQHFNVLNALLHRCLQEHDYKRASRAFAALLRFEIDGLHVDLRRQGLWGLGTEILLRNSSIDQSLSSDLVAKDGSLNSSDPASHNANIRIPTQQAFKAARDYLDRLRLQYPYRNHRPKDLSAKQIYPVMIGLWIFQIQADALRDLQLSEADTRQSKLDELRQAEQVRDTLDDLILSPPYDRDVHLLNLRGHVGLWMQELVLAMSPTDDAEGNALAVKAHFDSAQLAFGKAKEATAGPATDHTPETTSTSPSPASS